MSAHRFVIVRSDAKKPWHVRIVSNGNIILSSQQYSRQVGAERAILSAAHVFGLNRVGGMRWNVHGVEKVLTTEEGNYIGGLPTVLYVDERGKDQHVWTFDASLTAGTPPHTFKGVTA